MKMEKKIAVLFPGVGYSCDRPLLYYTRRICEECGYMIRIPDYGEIPGNAKQDEEHLRAAAMKMLESASESLIDSWDSYDDILFVSKSIGSVIANDLIFRRHIPARTICFTPLPFTFPHAQAPGIVFHGTKDPWAKDTELILRKARRAGQVIYAVEGANHSLETGRIQEDLDNLKTVMQRVSDFIEGKV